MSTSCNSFTAKDANNTITNFVYNDKSANYDDGLHIYANPKCPHKTQSITVDLKQGKSQGKNQNSSKRLTVMSIDNTKTQSRIDCKQRETEYKNNLIEASKIFMDKSEKGYEEKMKNYLNTNLRRYKEDCYQQDSKEGGAKSRKTKKRRASKKKSSGRRRRRRTSKK